MPTEHPAEAAARAYREHAVVSLPDAGGCRQCGELWAEVQQLHVRVAELQARGAELEVERDELRQRLATSEARREAAQAEIRRFWGRPGGGVGAGRAADRG